MKKIKIIIVVVLSIMSITGIVCLYNYIRIKTAKIEVTLVKDRKVEFNSDVKVSDYIKSINGKIEQDKKIDTTTLGKKIIKFSYINDDKIKVKYQYDIEVVDTVEPLIWLNDTYSVEVGSDINLTDKILCGDNYDSNPKCYIEGEYDLNQEGNYSLVFKAEDSSGNKEEHPFILQVYVPKQTSSDQENSGENYINFEDVVKNYKNKNNQIGIDVSKWQGDVDFDKLKQSGVEFVMIRVGGSLGKDGKYFLDDKFKINMEKAKKAKMPVGVYFYSYANSVTKAKKDAKWVLKQIKDYDLKLPISFDWEEWQDFNSYHLSFFGLTSMAEEFVKDIEKKGYNGLIYSSKAYLDNIWLETKYDIWLAHYTSVTNYEKTYKMWQLCNNGRVDGITGDVDIDIYYP